jgi:outer membrane protein OmpA-like peptidoglycan-associated protein/tetratricopeptide (TPR) repeat protein
MLRKILIFLVLILHSSFLVVFTYAQTQPLSTRSKKAIRLFLDAQNDYARRDYSKAVLELDKAIYDDSLFVEAYILKGDIWSEQRQIPEAVAAYKRALKVSPDFSANLYYIIANNELVIGRYSEAKADYLKYISFEKEPPERKTRANNSMKSCDFGINAMAHPVPFDPINLGDSVNTPLDEYVNAITSDDQRLYFTRKLGKNAQTIDQGLAYEEDFFYCDRIDSIWKKALNLGPPINTHGNEGALSISPDGNYIFFAACNRPDSYGSCDLYWSRKEGTTWLPPENLGPVVNSGTWDSQPSFSSDGKTLYFASKRPGGKGGSDIWKTELGSGNQWSVPVNLGDSINTRLDEMAPFIHPDDQTLYFSSRGHQGMGGLDLYLSRKDALDRWSGPVNLGYPINTYADEITLVVNASGDLAYISSDKFGGKGKQDIWSFKLYKEARPLKVNYFKGIVFNIETHQRLSAKFELIDLAKGTPVISSFSDPVNGEFLVCLPTNNNYGLNVSKEGYLFYSDNFLLSGENSKAKPFVKDIPLQPIKVGGTVVLKNIFFDTDKFDLKEESKAELWKLITLLTKNPQIRIEISGHTDNIASEEHNMILSRNRAESVYKYLIANGIKSDRLTFEGYGYSKPIDTNDTEQGRANNRRTEFKVIGN